MNIKAAAIAGLVAILNTAWIWARAKYEDTQTREAFKQRSAP